jgi:hypothetical protein
MHCFLVIAPISYRLSRFPVQFTKATDFTQIPELVTQYFGPGLNSETKETIRHTVKYKNLATLHLFTKADGLTKALIGVEPFRLTRT